jgi:hypothetical protein|tara:strand:+ start:612 stop:746 length:135 start_codon:yes stop_codon:yes gene_type:complete
LRLDDANAPFALLFFFPLPGPRVDFLELPDREAAVERFTDGEPR